VHEICEGQVTPSSSLFELPVAGVAWMAQVFPLRPSARVELLEELSNQLPTATQELAEVQVMPLNLLDALPKGAGGAWAVQVAPFHFSARGTSFEPFE
jgi:hypothetical protein